MLWPHPLYNPTKVRTEETAMHATISYHPAQVRKAGLRQQAQHATLARAARGSAGAAHRGQ